MDAPQAPRKRGWWLVLILVVFGLVGVLWILQSILWATGEAPFLYELK